VAATVAAIAMPIAPPGDWGCWTVPEVRPASWLATLARQAIEMGTKLKAVPGLGDEERPASVLYLPRRFPASPVAAFWR
jgi:hypothetical protein